MAEPTQLPSLSVYDAGLIRAAELGRALVDLEADYQPTYLPERSLCDLRFGLENTGRLADPAQALTVQAYVQETYGLGGVGLDPLLASMLPAIPAQGAEVRPFILGIQGGKVLGLQNGKLLGLGARLVLNAGPPVFNTTLTTLDPTEGAVTFTGDVGDSFEFNMPMNASTGGPQQMFLYVSGVSGQAAGVDFPLDAVGQYFRLNYKGVAYLGQFQIVAGNRVDLLPE